MKINKALKRLTHIEDLLADVTERYAGAAPDARQKLIDARATVAQVKESVTAQKSLMTKRAPKPAKRPAVKVTPAKVARKRKKPEGTRQK